MHVKGFVAACLGIDPEDPRLSGEEGDQATAAIAGFYDAKGVWKADGSGEQPCAGKELMLVCQNTKTKANTDFTLHLWSPVADG